MTDINFFTVLQPGRLKLKVLAEFYSLQKLKGKIFLSLS